MSGPGHTQAIRSLRSEDIPGVAKLYRRVFEDGLASDSALLEDYLERLFFTNPWREEADLDSGVLEGADGGIVGFLGIVPRKMLHHRKSIRVATPCHFMVDRSAASPLAAIRLLQRLFDGPQDLAIAEANEMSLPLWERLGGLTSRLYSLAWVAPLRPAGSALRNLATPWSWAARPVIASLDQLAARLPKSPFRRRRPNLTQSPLTPEALCACVATLTSGHSLRPDYDEDAARWLLEFVQAPPMSVQARGHVLRDDQGRDVGWYLYDAKPGKVSQLIQLGGREENLDDVVAHALYDAWREGSLALAGRFDSRFTQRIWNSPCLFSSSSRFTLVHARNPELLDALHRGDAFLSRLDGEWWIA